MKKLILLITVLTGNLAIFSQGLQQFSKSLYEDGYNFSHYSIEMTHNGSYIIGGTLIDQTSGNADMHLILMNDLGSIQWEKTIDHSNVERLLDVHQDINDDIIITGYAEVSGFNRAYVAKFDFLTGTMLYENQIEATNKHLVSQTIIQTLSGTYLIGGFLSSNTSIPMTGNAYAAELDANFNIVWETSIEGIRNEGECINNVIEIPGVGYFLTGESSHTDTIPIPIRDERGCLMVMLDYSGSLYWNMSAEASNNSQLGVEAVYNASEDRIYVLSNNSDRHNPQIDIIENSSSPTPNKGMVYELRIDNFLGSHPPKGAAAFGLMQSTTNSNHLIAAGYYMNDVYLNAINNSPAWIAKFEARSGKTIQARKFDIPNNLYNQSSINGSLFGLQANTVVQHPYVYTQDMLSVGPSGYTILVPKKINGFGLETIAMDSDFEGEHCGYDIYPDTTLPQPRSWGVAQNSLLNSLQSLGSSVTTFNSTGVLNYCPNCGISASFNTSLLSSNCTNSNYEFDATASIISSNLTLVNYNWDFGDGTPSVSGQIVQHTFTNCSTYEVCLTITAYNDFLGEDCEETICKNVSIDKGSGCPDCNNSQGSSGNPRGSSYRISSKANSTNEISRIIVLPNPSSGRFEVQFSESNYDRLIIYNLLGEVVKEVKLNHDQTQSHLDLTDQPNGIYLVSVIGKNGRETIKVSKQ